MDDLQTGRFGGKLVGTNNGYELYEEPIGKTSRQLSYGFRSASGDYVIVTDPGSWSTRYHMIFLEPGKYVVKCYFGKELGVAFRDMHASTSKFIAEFTMKTSQN